MIPNVNLFVCSIYKTHELFGKNIMDVQSEFGRDSVQRLNLTVGHFKDNLLIGKEYGLQRVCTDGKVIGARLS